MLNFWKAPYPFNDFLLFSFKQESKHKSMISNLKQKLQSVGISFFKQQQFGEYMCLVASGVEATSEIVFSGVAQEGGTFYYGQNGAEKIPDDVDISESVGIFTLLRIEKNNTIKIAQDFFGCGSLFYAEYDQSIIVSNRYHLLLLFLSWIGFRGELNQAKMIASLYSNSNFLAQQNISRQMDITGTFQLALDEEINIDSRGWAIKERKVVKDSLAGVGVTEHSREDLIMKAKDEIILNIQAVLDSKEFTEHTVDLSGGFDSRAVFAAILNIHNSMDIFSINTRDVPGSSDLSIAAGIKNYFGGKYFVEKDRPQHPITLEDSLGIWRSYFMGTYYRLGISAWSPMGNNIHQIRLSGGCGEIYRTFWYRAYGSKVSNAKDIEQISRKLVKMFVPLSKPNDHKQKLLAELISQELSQLPGDGPIEKLENHYLYYRNRYHFGLRAYEYYHDSSIWFPLMSKSLFAASREIPIEDRDDNKLMIEITQALCSPLVRMDYDSAPMKNNKLLHSMGISACQRIELDSSYEDWKVVEKINQDSKIKNRAKQNNEFYVEWRECNHLIRERLISVMEDLKNYNCEMNDLLDDAFLAHLEKNLQNNRYIYEKYAKLFSIKDQLDLFA